MVRVTTGAGGRALNRQSVVKCLARYFRRGVNSGNRLPTIGPSTHPHNIPDWTRWFVFSIRAGYNGRSGLPNSAVSSPQSKLGSSMIRAIAPANVFRNPKSTTAYQVLALSFV